MKARVDFFFLASLLFATWVDCAAIGAAPDQLRKALSALDVELKQDSGRRERWREVLHSGELERLVELETADLKVRDIESIRRRYLYTEVPPYERLIQDAGQSVDDWLANSDDGQEEELLDQASEAVRELYGSFRRTPRRLWDPILGMNDISSELRRGEEANRETVRDRLSGLVAEADHLDRTRFVDVRRALGHWVTEVEDPVTDPLAIAVRQAKTKFRRVETWRADQGLIYLRERLRLLDMYLRLDADWKRTGWEQFLEIGKLNREIGQPRDARLVVLNKILGQFDSGELGLQRPAFRNTRDSLRQYIDLLQMTEGNAARIHQSRERLNASLNLLNQFLASGGPNKEAGWKDFLAWDRLTAELAKSNPNVRELRTIVRKFKSDQPGLEILPFRLAARRLDKYVELRLIERSSTKPIDIYDGKLDKLARDLEAHSKAPAAITAADISLQTKWLDAIGQSPELVHRIRNRYSHDNVFGSISGNLIGDRVKDVLTDRTPIDRMFDGVRISGTAVTRANVRGQLIPSLEGVILDILLSGTTTTSTVGQRRRVSVYSTGATSLAGRKRLMFDFHKGVQTMPATATAGTHQQINDVHVDRMFGRRLVKRVATRKAWEAIPKAKSMANDEARRTIARQMDEQAEPMLRELNEQLRDKVKAPMRERGFRPEMFRVSSSSSHVELKSRLTPHNYFGAPIEPPAWNHDHDVAICLHESALNNSLAGFFGGVRIDNQNIVKILRLYNLDVPDELKDELGGDGRPGEVWSMTFDLHHPISVSIGVDRIHARIMGMAFEQSDTKINERIRIGASYKVHWKPKQLPSVERDGDVEVEFVDSPNKLSTRQLTTKTFLLRKLGALFKDRIDLSEMDTGEVTELLQSITLKRASLYQGWFAAALDVDADALPRRQ